MNMNEPLDRDSGQEKKLRLDLQAHMQTLSYSRRRHEVFNDFVTMAACAISNQFDHIHYQDREELFEKVKAKYSAKEWPAFPEMLGQLKMLLKIRPGDVLGKLFMDLELGNKHTGQFFTPYHISLLMAKVTIGPEAVNTIKTKGFFNVMEPAAGGGAMIIAVAEEVMNAGFDVSETMHVTAVDIDSIAVMMSYIQFSLLDIPAIVIHGDTLRMQEHSHWYTPQHILGGWKQKLEARRAEATEEADPIREAQSVDDESDSSMAPR